MDMDYPFNNLPDSINGFKWNNEAAIPGFKQSTNDADGLEFEGSSCNLNFMDNYAIPPRFDSGNSAPSLNGSSEVDSLDDHDSDPMLKFVNQILLEENMDEKSSMFHDPVALRAAEKSFYDVIGEKYPPSPYHQSPVYIDLTVESPDCLFGSTSENSTSSTSSRGNSVDPQCGVDPGDHRFPGEELDPLIGSIESSLTNSQPFANYTSSYGPYGSTTNNQVDSFVRTNKIPNILSDNESILQFKRGMEEALKFLPRNNQVIIDLDKYRLPPKSVFQAPDNVFKVEKDEKGHPTTYARGRKHLLRQDSELEEQRSRKLSALCEEEVDLSEKFDKILLCDDKRDYGLSQVSGSGNSPTTKHEAKNETLDLRNLFVSCAQGVASDDHKTANELLKQIRQYASSTGDPCQRLANTFANGIEARLAGTGTEIYAAFDSKRISAAEKLEAYRVYLSASPFKKIAISFASKMSLEAAAKSSTLHIVDFGISYGFQWPMLIQRLSIRPGGPPKLRITGIDIPQPGFRPAELIEATGRRLAKYCKKFNVPFEYQAIATNSWEKIKIEDLKLARDEVLVVNCHCRFKNLLDETVAVESPRDAVLNLIRKMKPDLFVQSIVNGSFSAPFFVTRFREALFYYSALFDMLDVTLPREQQQMLNLEIEFYGREVVNVIACEGPQRVERPETYKQWQIRVMRAGFKPLPLNKDFLKKLKSKVMAGFHKDFIFGEDGNWMLQGWKGRILYGSSCWVPA